MRQADITFFQINAFSVNTLSLNRTDTVISRPGSPYDGLCSNLTINISIIICQSTSTCILVLIQPSPYDSA